MNARFSLASGPRAQIVGLGLVQGDMQMIMNMKSVALATLLFAFGGVAAGSASAMPLGGAASDAAVGPARLARTVRWVCPPYRRCVWVEDHWRRPGWDRHEHEHDRDRRRRDYDRY